jgi:peptide/nickel transport system ATP-binding protein
VTILAIEDLKIEYRIRGFVARAVDGASFSVPRGEMVGLVGESGCGKTTVSRAIIGVMPSAAHIAGGRILFEGRDLVTMTTRERRPLLWRDIAFIPQSAMNSLDPVYRVGTQIKEVLKNRAGITGRAAEDRVAELFSMVGLDARRARDYPHQFSGGMRQRAAIALALALEPKLVIADEPVTALDVIVQRQVLDTFRALQEKLRISVILVTHDISVVAYACDRVVVMYAGKTVESGPVYSVLEMPGHPYTMGLYNAFPDLGRAGGELVPIAGSPPDLRRPPPGCRFAPRCPFVLEDCAEVEPSLMPTGAGHLAACLRMAEVARLRDKAKDPKTWARFSTSGA